MDEENSYSGGCKHKAFNAASLNITYAFDLLKTLYPDCLGFWVGYGEFTQICQYPKLKRILLGLLKLQFSAISWIVITNFVFYGTNLKNSNRVITLSKEELILYSVQPVKHNLY